MFNIKNIKMPLRCVFVILLLLMFLVPTSSLAKVFGPYPGQVLDVQTEKPIKGASLFVYLTRYHLAIGPAGSEYYPEVIKSILFYTDNKGNFTIPTKLISTGILGSLETTSFIVYQPGYQVYINSDSSLNKEPNNAKEKDNIIMLDRIPPNFDHKKHFEKITRALSEIGEIEIIPPIDYYASPKGDIRMDWDKFVHKSQPSILKEEFLRRAEWENRRE